MLDFHSPCSTCSAVNPNLCNGKTCDRWRIRYLYRQKQINAWAKKTYGHIEVKNNRWVYMHPDEYRRYIASDPCEGCPCAAWCDDPCQKYLAHFREKMEHLRKRAESHE